jgi:hypothetical protein
VALQGWRVPPSARDRYLGHAARQLQRERTMTRRSVIAVLLLSLVTFGIYFLVWMVMTKNEMNRQGANIPTALLLIIPLVNIYWMWKYAEGVELVTDRRMSGPVAFLVLWLLGIIGGAIVQSEFNRLAVLPEARLA